MRDGYVNANGGDGSGSGSKKVNGDIQGPTAWEVGYSLRRLELHIVLSAYKKVG
jgi:hypothetical protein